MASRPVIGLDLGTSGCRALAVDATGHVIAAAAVDLPAPQRDGARVWQDPACWWQAVVAVLARLAADLRALVTAPPRALALDGTSATLLLCTPDGRPLGPALMYNDASAAAAADWIARCAPADSPARGASASLAKLLHLLQTRAPVAGPVLALHQADWIGARLRGCYVRAGRGESDWNNGLKLGFDPVSGRWPDWLRMPPPVAAPAHWRAAWAGVWAALPHCHPPGQDLGAIDPTLARHLGLPVDLRILAGTTDSTAAALAAGIQAPGDAVTSLGSTLVLKLASPRPVNAASHGIYSHRIGDLWLAGGASNSGGAVLRQFFDDARLAALSAQIDPSRPSGLDYYPLPAIGERFPHADAHLAPRLTPRPADDAHFLAGLFEGIAHIERAGYARLTALGAPPPRRILSVGGGAGNRQWTAIRARILGLPVLPAARQDAAYGAARLALSAQPVGTTTAGSMPCG
ncbi:MAG: carbohydrate kinase [Chromatiaceae bacterium]|nr:MAG: carbohydrate kinase [Chromatiaceae bacterium]